MSEQKRLDGVFERNNIESPEDKDEFNLYRKENADTDIIRASWSGMESPEEWTPETVGEHIDVTGGKAFSSDNFTTNHSNGKPLVKRKTVNNKQYPETVLTRDFDDQYLVNNGDLLVSMDRYFKCMLWQYGDAALNQRVCRIRTSERINTQYISYALQTPLSFLEHLGGTTDFTSLSIKEFDNIELAIPPISEQRKIATVLHNVERGITKTDEIINRLEHILTGTRRKLMRDGTNEEQKVQTDSRFGSVPKSWEIKRLDSVADVLGGSTPSTDEPEYWDGDIPWATPTDITELAGAEIETTNDYISEEGLQSTSIHLLPSKSVLMTSRATIGECAVNLVDMATNQGFQNLVPGDRLETWYLHYRMKEEAAYLESLASGSTFSEISNTAVKRVQIPVPPIDEQKKIADRLRSIDKLLLKEKEYQNQLRTLKQGLMQELLTGNIRTTDTNIEVLDEVTQHG